MNEPLDNKTRLYSSMFLSFIMTIVVTIIALSAILYFQFERIALNQSFGFTMNNLAQTSREASVMSVTAGTFAKQIYYDGHIRKLLNFSDLDIVDTNSALSQLNSYKATSPFIDSIYVYNANNGSFYISSDVSGYAVQSGAEFYDREIVDIVHHLRSYPTLVPIPRRMPVESKTTTLETERDVYTFLLYDTLNSGSSDNVIIVNISETQMHKNIDGMMTSSENNTFIVDNQGRLVSNSWKTAMLTDISATSYMKTILSRDESGYFIDDVEGVRSLVTYTVPDYLGWRYVRIVPYSTITSQINDLRVKTIVSAVLILLAGLGIAYFISRRLYSKVHLRLSRLLLLEMEKRENLLVRRQEFARNLLLGWEKHDLAKTQSCLEQLNMPIGAADECRVVLLKIDRYAQFAANFPNQDRILLKYGIANVSEEILSERYKVAAAEMGESRIALLLNAGDAGNLHDDAALEAIIRRIQSAVSSYLQLTVSVTFSSAGSSVLQVPVLYNQVLDASLHGLFYGEECVIKAAAIEEYKAKSYEYPIQRQKQLIEDLMLGKLAEAKAAVRDILDDTAQYSYASFHVALSQVAFAIQNAITTIKRNSDADFEINVNALLERLHHMETLHELYEGFDGIFDDLSVYFSEKKNTKHDELVQKMMTIVDSTYMDQDLSLESIADSLGMSADYIGKLFKKITFKTILNYIMEVRMRKAHEMLIETDYTVNEIAEKSGFSNSSYFHKAFKKCNGVTPIDFRKRAKQEEPA